MHPQVLKSDYCVLIIVSVTILLWVKVNLLEDTPLKGH